jgi:catechol 2,3-dioxygenase-like lactoylglutathione lyase family enzyme
MASESANPSTGRGRVIGIGGVFFKSDNPGALTDWYCKHLGFKPDQHSGVNFPWRTADNDASQRTVWAIFPSDTKYFEPTESQHLINYIVDDLDALLDRLRAEGVQIHPQQQTDAAGRFAWIFDADGNKVELWEPAKLES